MSTSTAAPKSISLFRRFRVPLLAVALPIGAFLLRKVSSRADFGPNAEMALPLLMPASVVLGALIFAVWFLFFSGFRGRVILATLGVIAALLVLAMIPIRNIELSGTWTPLVIWRWQGGRFPVKPAEGQLPEIDLTIGPGDFPRFRGETGDGVVRGVQFTKMPTAERWRQPIGGGYAGFAAAGNVLVTIEQRGDKEAVVCYDQDTGRERWIYDYPAQFVRSEPMGGDGPRATPAIYEGDIYSLGATGMLARLDGKTGKPRWAVDILKDAGAENVSWGMAGSPLVVDGRVIVNPGINPKKNAKKAVAVYDCETGKPAWQKGDKPAGYSSPMLANFGDSYQVVVFDGGGVAGFDFATGDELWRYPWTTMSEMNCIQPLILDGDRVFISSELSNGCALVQIARDGDRWSAAKIWQNRSMGSKFSNPVAHDGHIYGMSNGSLICLDANTGERKWRGDNYGHGQILLIGDVLLIQTEFGDLVAVAADPTEPRILGERQVFEGGKTWNTPALARGRLFLRTHKEMVCFDWP